MVILRTSKKRQFKNQRKEIIKEKNEYFPSSFWFWKPFGRPRNQKFFPLVKPGNKPVKKLGPWKEAPIFNGLVLPKKVK